MAFTAGTFVVKAPDFNPLSSKPTGLIMHKLSSSAIFFSSTKKRRRFQLQLKKKTMATVAEVLNGTTNNGALANEDKVTSSSLALTAKKPPATFELTLLVTVKKTHQKLNINETMPRWFGDQGHNDPKGVVVLQLVSTETDPISKYLVNFLMPNYIVS